MKLVPVANSEEIKRQQTALQRRLRKSERCLVACDPRLAAWISQTGKCDLQVAWERSLYEALVRAIAHQQLHARAADCILGRLTAAYARTGNAFPTPKQLSQAKSQRLRSFGFSTAKVSALHGIARAALNGEIPSREEACTLSDEELIERLVTLRGVGRWTVEMLLIFTLGRLDVMPTDDFGIRSGLQHLCGLQTHPKKADFANLTNHWAPHRSVAAWYLWRLADARK